MSSRILKKYYSWVHKWLILQLFLIRVSSAELCLISNTINKKSALIPEPTLLSQEKGQRALFRDSLGKGNLFNRAMISLCALLLYSLTNQKGRSSLASSLFTPYGECNVPWKATLSASLKLQIFYHDNGNTYRDPQGENRRILQEAPY